MSNIFNDLLTGVVELDTSEEYMTESVLPDKLEYLKTRNIQLHLPPGIPTGKGNLVFLYNNTFEDGLELMTSTTNCLSKNKYKNYYFNPIYIGKIYNTRYRYKLIPYRNSLYEKVNKNTNIKPILNPATLVKLKTNVYYDLHKYLEVFNGITKKFNPLKIVNLYWSYFSKVLNPSQFSSYRNKFVICDITKFPLSKDITANLLNPIYMIYYTLYKKESLLKDIDIDFYFYNERKVLKINPTHLTRKHDLPIVKREINRIMAGVVPVTVTEVSTSDEFIKKEEVASNIVSKLIKPVLGAVVTNPDEIKDAVADTAEEREIKEIIKNKVDAIDASKPSEDTAENDEPISDTDNDTPNTSAEDESDTVDDNNTDDIDSVADRTTDPDTDVDKSESEIIKELNDDKELISKIYYQNKAKENTKSTASSARDELLRKQQMKLKVKDMTVEDIMKINTNDIKVPVTDVSSNLTTTNEYVKHINYDNVDKTYNREVMEKDIVNSIMILNNKSIPMYILNVDVQDTSNELNYKDTYTIKFEDANRNRHTVKVDIPKFIDDKFLYLGGNKKIIKHQNFQLPVVKVTDSRVQIVTNYSKMEVERVDNKSISYIERMKKLVTASPEVNKMFTLGEAFTSNTNFITTLEYDEFSKAFLKFQTGKTIIMFDCTEAAEYMRKNGIKEKENKLYIGKDNGKDIYIDIDTQKDDKDRYIFDIIVDNLSEAQVADFIAIKRQKSLIYTRVKLMGVFVAVVLLLGLWEGLSKVLEKANIKYRIEPSNVRTSSLDVKPNEAIVEFKDARLIYEETPVSAMLMGGLNYIKTKDYEYAAMDTKDPYLPYISKIYGSPIIENALMNFYEFLIDPITKEILNKLDMPEDIVSIFIYAINLLADSQHKLDIDQNLYRVRMGEIIPAILYEKLAKNYVQFRTYNGKKKYTIPQDCVIKEILALKTVEDYSTLNPFLELQQLHAISTKGFRGINLDDYYTMERRGSSTSSTGVIAPSSSPDGSVGVNKTLTLEPMIDNVRGLAKDYTGELDKLNLTNLNSAAELCMPMAAVIDDPTRLGRKQCVAESIINSFNCGNFLIYITTKSA